MKRRLGGSGGWATEQQSSWTHWKDIGGSFQDLVIL